MKIRTVEFVKSVADAAEAPKAPYPVVAFAGRSNVGKSSLINALLQRKRTAYISRTPGKTRLINFFSVNEALYFADLPGYGFARVSQTMREEWQRLIESFLLHNHNIRLVIVILDVRRGITELDKQLLDWLEAHAIQSLLVITKCDKVSKNESAALQRRIMQERVLSFEPILFSAVKLTGISEVWSAISHECFMSK